MNHEVFQHISQIGKEEWEKMISHRFFLSYNYLHTLELGCPDLEYRYVVFKDDEKLIGICYFQIIPFSGKNLNQYVPESNKFLQYILTKILSWIQTNLLVLGNVIFTCENGVYIHSDSDYAPDEIISKAIKLVNKDYRKPTLATMISENIMKVSTGIFCSAGFHPFKVEDRMEINISEFETFDVYKLSLQSKYRQRVNKTYELNLNLKEIEITSENFELFRPEMDVLFQNVLENSKFKLTQISMDYFLAFVQNVQRFKILGFLNEDKLVAFVTYFQLDTILEVHYIGIDYDYNEKNKIYNYILYNLLNKGIELRVKSICYGRTAQEMKSTIGALPYSTFSSLKLNNKLINILTPIILKKLYPSSWILRNPYKSTS